MDYTFYVIFLIYGYLQFQKTVRRFPFKCITQLQTVRAFLFSGIHHIKFRFRQLDLPGSVRHSFVFFHRQQFLILFYYIKQYPHRHIIIQRRLVLHQYNQPAAHHKADVIIHVNRKDIFQLYVLKLAVFHIRVFRMHQKVCRPAVFRDFKQAGEKAVLIFSVHIDRQLRFHHLFFSQDQARLFFFFTALSQYCCFFFRHNPSLPCMILAAFYFVPVEYPSFLPQAYNLPVNNSSPGNHPVWLLSFQPCNHSLPSL